MIIIERLVVNRFRATRSRKKFFRKIAANIKSIARSIVRYVMTHVSVRISRRIRIKLPITRIKYRNYANKYQHLRVCIMVKIPPRHLLLCESRNDTDTTKILRFTSETFFLKSSSCVKRQNNADWYYDSHGIVQFLSLSLFLARPLTLSLFSTNVKAWRVYVVMYRNEARLLPWGSRRIRRRPSSSVCKNRLRRWSPWKGTEPNLRGVTGKNKDPPDQRSCLAFCRSVAATLRLILGYRFGDYRDTSSKLRRSRDIIELNKFNNK